ncbi:hypothetical protein GCM10011529_23460 [Polymorphobacter glacialis]|uniref:Preprotein translocase subunit YajC n=1 Tax=Sandarakinorhabdus glacialis TaxID=1614636 RepID=A0A917EB23_9SPHN|nr:hypothetical protein [Polymorphobacter glacialis]GGE16373.1 hypothetical protein GCM10011529_23460 [Polymorphobacter glacialis]
MRSYTTIGIVLALSAGTASFAQTAAAPAASASAQLSAGAPIFDTAGTQIATVDSINGDNVVVSTGTNKIAIPKASFGVGEKGAVIAATKEQLDGAAGQAATAAKQALLSKMTPGAEVRGTGGATLGKVKAVEGDIVLVETPKGEVRVPSAGFSAGPAGLVLGMSAADFEAAVAAATPAV